MQRLQRQMKETGNVTKQMYLFQGDDADEAANAGDVGVVQAQQGKDGVGL